MLDCGWFLDLRDGLQEECNWEAPPSDQVVERCHRLARSLVDEGDDATAEVAAIFFAFSRERDALGDAWKEMSVMAAMRQWLANDLRFSISNNRALFELQEDVASGAVNWPQVKRWFASRLVPRSM